ncbi:MAG: sulfate adenylyltransferase, partial [Candidatus Bathyarchaeota archaeon]|nr:sulfate adenylyltransferase [Candidatus Bathyarchaeota archaeon]
MSTPHGGKLIDRLVPEEKRESTATEAAELPFIDVNFELRKDVENISWGAYSPLVGPVTRNDYDSILDRGRLQNDLPWTVPIILDVPEEQAFKIKEEDIVALSCNNERFATLKVEEKYRLDKKNHAQSIYKTMDPSHPGVAKTNGMNSMLLGGPVRIFKETSGAFPKYRLTPKETRVLFREKKWRTIAGFQTRNAPHVGHEYVQKTALSFVDGLFLNPLIGKKKAGDFTDEVIIETYEVMVQRYYVPNTAVLVTLEMEMRYAGPKEAIFHAIIRKNFGCTHFLIGRDHAGVGNYYGPYEAQEIFSKYPDLGIQPV